MYQQRVTSERPKDLRAAEKKTERLLAVRERSAGELRQRLLRDGFASDITDTIIERLVITGLVDDERFCRLYIQGKRRQGWGMRRIADQLKTLSVNIDDYPDLFTLYDEGDELRRATIALAGYRGRAKDAYAGRYRYLAAKGYASDIIKQALRNWVRDSIG